MAEKVTKSSPFLAWLLEKSVRGFGAMPLSMARRFGAGLGQMLWRIPNQFRRNSLENVDRCFPELTGEERRRIVRESLRSTGLTVAEAGAMFHWPLERLRALEQGCAGSEVLDRAVDRGKGVIALGPHVGNWEYLSYSVSRRHPMVCLYRRPRVSEFDAYLRRARERLGSELVPVSASGIRRLVRTLERGGVVGILPDQEPLKSHGVFAPFFGTEALTMTLVGTLARRYDSAVVLGVAARQEDGGFGIDIRAGSEEMRHPDPVRAASALNSGVEAFVRDYPEQYIWSYRRFRTRPPAEVAALLEKAGAR